MNVWKYDPVPVLAVQNVPAPFQYVKIVGSEINHMFKKFLSGPVLASIFFLQVLPMNIYVKHILI